jgi:RNA polymerase sigma factor (sigma-70 family)
LLHKDWIKIVGTLGEQLYAEDIVQEMYLKMATLPNIERFYLNGKLNRNFVWTVLRNMTCDYQKSKQRLVKVNISEAMQVKDDYEPELLEGKRKIETRINQEIKSWHWYDQLLFDLYRTSGMSTRKIEGVTGISFKSVWKTIKVCKDRLKENVGEDYQDFVNNDYELIK